MQFGDVWRTFATPAGVIFQTNRVIFRLANDKISVIRPTARMGRASFLDGQLYATVADSGLNVLEGDHFKKLPGTEALAREPFPGGPPLRPASPPHRHEVERAVPV